MVKSIGEFSGTLEQVSSTFDSMIEPRTDVINPETREVKDRGLAKVLDLIS